MARRRVIASVLDNFLGTYCRERSLFVAPHDPNFERRATVR